MRFLWILFVVLLPGLVYAGVQGVSVTTTGQGKSMAEALNTALLQAITQVNGKTLESDSVQSNLRASSEYQRDTSLAARGTATGRVGGQNVDNKLSVNVDASLNDKASLTSDAYMQTIKEQTGGAVLSYVISSSRKDESGIWTVTAISKVAKYERSAEAKRKRIAIVPFRATIRDLSFNGQRMAQQEVVRQLSQALSSPLVQSAKFTVLDREFESELGSELEKIQSGNIAKDDYARLGQKLITDYLLVGVIDDFRFIRNERAMRLSGTKIVTNEAVAAVSFRLVEVATGQAVMSDSVRVRLDNAALQAKGSTAGKEMLGQIGSAISDKIIDQVYPPSVIAVEGQRVVIGQGGNTFREGEVINLYRVGKEMFDPYTKESLGRQEKFCCTAKIGRVTPKSSYAEVQEPGIDLAAGFRPGDLLVRERVKVKTVSVKPAANSKNAQLPQTTSPENAEKDEKSW